MVFYASVPENNAIVQQAKAEFRNGIVIRREQIEDYVAEADCILIGPGMVRAEKGQAARSLYQVASLGDIPDDMEEGIQTRVVAEYLLQKYPHKKWVIDAGALQMIDPEWLLPLPNVIITPHPKEFERLFGILPTPETVQALSKKYGCIIVLKGHEDIVSRPDEAVVIAGGNPGMTKGGTGDVLAGLIASLACTNDMWLSACAGSFFNKRAGESLEERMGLYFNASDLALEIPSVMRTWLTHQTS